MTPYLQVLSRLLQSFWHINNATDFVSVFAPISLQEITSEEDRANESLAPIPVQIHLFAFKDLNGRARSFFIKNRKSIFTPAVAG